MTDGKSWGNCYNSSSALEKYRAKTNDYEKYDLSEIYTDYSFHITIIDMKSGQIDAHQDIATVIAEAATENIDAARIACILGDPDP